MYKTDATEHEIETVVRALRVRRRVTEASGPHAKADCVACGKREHLYVNLRTGLWNCMKCEASLGFDARRVGVCPEGAKSLDRWLAVVSGSRLLGGCQTVKTVDFAGVSPSLCAEAQAKVKRFQPSNPLLARGAAGILARFGPNRHKEDET